MHCYPHALQPDHVPILGLAFALLYLHAPVVRSGHVLSYGTAFYILHFHALALRLYRVPFFTAAPRYYHALVLRSGHVLGHGTVAYHFLLFYALFHRSGHVHIPGFLAYRAFPYHHAVSESGVVSFLVGRPPAHAPPGAQVGAARPQGRGRLRQGLAGGLDEGAPLGWRGCPCAVLFHEVAPAPHEKPHIYCQAIVVSQADV